MKLNKILLVSTCMTAPLVSLAFPSSVYADASKSLEATAVAVKAVRVIAHEHHHNFQIKGRVAAQEDVALQAQATGYLMSKHFKEGDIVAQGELLFSLDDSRYLAKLAQAKSLLASADANLNVAKLDYKRGISLLPGSSISAAEVDGLLAAEQLAQAQITSAKAQIQLAQTELDYTQIRAPFSGRISNSKVALGELVSPSSEALADLVTVSPIDVSFQVSERVFHQAKKKIRATGADLPSVSLFFDSGEAFSEIGEITYLGNRVDKSMGTVAVRAEFDNQKQLLLPGQYVELTVKESLAESVLLVPQRALLQDLSGFYVFVVGEDALVERRNIDIGELVGNLIIVNTGVMADEVVITHGLQQIKTGSLVNAKLVDAVNSQLMVAGA
ncbi:efflux RND transporter periplasmic adaptor subunit [Shewanella eurypsychrophilus]|uniref:Efflux RND transporter periplasmic adaptor subunit n=1 Tax=Shewanella eurypsychrophilus TaxID=2593656 RepID=A0ABX6VBA8_9GAMM|nr:MULTISPECIES: efflux RND transporter periplasmic adaptor subunit [Shewanella]QFU24093.1 efflux RND transporter periplasmic adaptor subunit [Shewanella sp. YLB-09]QPG59302.1 efflux RND transporter periplasmic adaptor subunit [Shewanella eurypsychrophilus]